MAQRKLKAATCQFPVSGNLDRNAKYILRYIKRAADMEADVVHRTITPLNQMKAREYGMWVIANNSSARHSCWPTFIAGPDGYFRSLKRHVSGILFHEIPPGESIRKPFYHTGKASRHPRAVDTRSLP